MSPQQKIRNAKNSEARLVSEILADAFSDDPVMNWMNPQSHIYPSLFALEARALYLKRGFVQLNESASGAAMWLPPEVSHQAPLHWALLPMLWNLFITGGLQSLRRGTQLEAEFAANHYTEPHYYLFAIGARQGHQGRGVGSALLRSGLEIVDQNRQAAYLESSNIANNILYQRFGFEVIGEIQLPEQGPIVWQMLREAR